MRTGDFVPLALVVYVAGCIACNSSNSSNGISSRESSSPSGQAAGDTTNPNLFTKTSLCNPVCEVVAYSQRRTDLGAQRTIGLLPEESASLKSALKSTGVSGNANTLHVHADAARNQLSFTADSPNDPTRESHVSNPDTQVVLTNPRGASSSSPVTVVTTPAAMQLLRQRPALRINGRS
jgi:hypothetical protein